MAVGAEGGGDVTALVGGAETGGVPRPSTDTLLAVWETGGSMDVGLSLPHPGAKPRATAAVTMTVRMTVRLRRFLCVRIAAPLLH
jgi:hypothetical protein